MTTTEVLMLFQAIIMLATGAVIVWYTVETRRLRAVASAEFEVLHSTYALQIEEMKRAAEPIFVWADGSSNPEHVEWQFTNEGGSISHLTVTMQSPDGVRAHIRPQEWLGNSKEGTVTFDGNTNGELRFSIGFRTRIGGVGSFFFSASRMSKPAVIGSGWFE